MEVAKKILDMGLEIDKVIQATPLTQKGSEVLMKLYKLENKKQIFNFNQEEIGVILKYRFNAVECNNKEIIARKLRYGVKQIAYTINDENLLASIRLPEEKEEHDEYISYCLEEGDAVEESCIIVMEFDSSNHIVYTRRIGNFPRYLDEEVTILTGNDYENYTEYRKYKNLYGEKLDETLKETNEKYMRLLKEHGYID